MSALIVNDAVDGNKERRITSIKSVSRQGIDQGRTLQAPRVRRKLAGSEITLALGKDLHEKNKKEN